jgi:CRISPR-associated protein Cas2
LHLVVCYDIVDNRRRARLARKLRGYLDRVQKSVFEGEVAEDRLEPLRQMLLEEMDGATDMVHMYTLCARCVPAVEVLGVGIYVDTDDVDEVV